MRAALLCCATLLFAACQPQSRRLLLVDLTLSDPLVLESTAAPWHAAGYQVDYRRFYPHLTRQDLARYCTVVLLGGREPEGLSDALTIGDLAILTEWVRRGGVVVLGYSSDREGSLDRWIMNRWLAAQGAGIAIGNQALEDTVRAVAAPLDPPAVPIPSSALDNAGSEPFAAGRNHVLLVRDGSQALARTTASAFTRQPGAEPAARHRAAVVAATRVTDGLILVASRHALAATGIDVRSSTRPALVTPQELARTREFLVALARWTRRPAEWAGVAPAVAPAPLILGAAPRPIAVHPPPLVPPAGAIVLTIPRPLTPIPEEARAVVPGWIARQGMRVLWSRFAPMDVDSLLAFVDAAALNALATIVPIPALADTLRTRSFWKVSAERLQTTSLRWFPAVVLAEIPSLGADELDRHGELVAAPCGLDTAFWHGALRPTFRALARLGGARPDLIAGIALDLDTASSRYGGSGFCDADYRDGLAALGFDRAEVERLAALPPVARYDTLLERGLVGRYFETLEASVAERAVALRAELRRLHPDLRFAFRATEAPADWFSLGLLRGLSTREAPVLLWTREPPRYRERGIVALSAIMVDPRLVSAHEWGRLRPLVFGEHDGFWLPRATTDSVGRLIRRLSKEALPGGPPRQ
ncbi:MAG TPA: hypothetical protein VN908_03945 [Gemmatimonadales bacterium]|nr:hypothetical protein [Gemmatimonadales bacterium]